MKRSLAEKDKLLEDMAKEREQLISDYTNYISHLQSQINNLGWHDNLRNASAFVRNGCARYLNRFNIRDRRASVCFLDG